MNLIFDINSALIQLWTTQLPADAPRLMPMQYAEPPKAPIVFVGLNPSFSEDGILRNQTLANALPVNAREFFAWPQHASFDLTKCLALESYAHTHYPFFAWHREIKKASDLPWVHYDIFAIRETSQQTVQSLTCSGADPIGLTPFGAAQLAIFHDLLALATPRAVVVVNALAAQIYLQQRRPRFDPATGHYLDTTPGGQAFPVFLSGMLTGARALDRHSRTRLIWQVLHALGVSWQP